MLSVPLTGMELYEDRRFCSFCPLFCPQCLHMGVDSKYLLVSFMILHQVCTRARALEPRHVHVTQE